MFQDAKLYEEAYDQAVRKNAEAIAAIEEFKKELEGVKETLEENQKHLFQPIMAPLAGGKALMKGKLVHTNDVMVFLGDKWFVRTSAARAIDICNRKIARCNENKAEIETQTERFSSNMEKVQEYELFSGADLQDIVEPYDEEAEKLWRAKHREKVREFKKQEAAERDKCRDEDLFKKLDVADGEDNDFESDETDSDSSDEDEDNVTENTDAPVQPADSNKVSNFSHLPNVVLKSGCPVDNGDETSNIIANGHAKSLESSNSFGPYEHHEVPSNFNSSEENHIFSPTFKKPYSSFENMNALDRRDSVCSDEDTSQKESAVKKRVSFSTTDELKCYLPLESDDDTNIIRFKHSEVPPPTLHKTDKIESPSDIYQLIVQGFNLKSILKKGTKQFPESMPLPTETMREWKTSCDNFNLEYSSSEVHEEVVFGDISEKNPVLVSKIDTASKKPSKFRQARNKH
ncbi:hypothetical protein V9T40_004869 [Parthenolecanium corni]|uniref:Unconventional prefoldin RPB5 interactor n=1 Tax=Parthenolecanium corni TaxID=536013 RepID=A0AAN9Y253_9HEMI